MENKAGCEEYLYKSMQCCLHPCPVNNCPEPICAIDFPGGVRAYQRFCLMQSILRGGKDLDEAAKELNISRDAIERLFKKQRRIRTFV